MTTATRRARPPVVAADRADGWRDHSACRDVESELFFPLGGPIQSRTGANLAQERAAKAVCYRCPVREACLRDALRAGDEWGIWGGLNERERRELSAPKPLSPALQAANARSAEVRAARVAERTHCDKGHELTPENTYHDRSQRVCRPCRLEYQRSYREAQKAVRA